MGKGRTQKTPTDQTVRQTSLPKFADPYFRRLLQGAEEASMPFDPETGQSTYIPYSGERIAPSDMYGDIMGSRAMVRGISETGIPGMGAATGAAEYGMGYGQEALSGLSGAAQYTPGQFSEYGGTEAFQYQDPETFTGAAVEQYMSPYMQAVVDRQKQQAMLDFERMRAGRSAQAVGAGAFGGSRAAVQEALAEEALGRQLGDIQAQGTQAAFQQAAQQFGLDRAARMQAEQSRAAEAARVQGAGLSEAARVQAAREAAAQFGAGQGLAGYQALMSGAGQYAGLGAGLAGLGERQRAADIQGAQLMETIGRDIRAEDQARLDMAYEDFARQRDYPMQQYERFAAMLRGVPVTPNVEEQRFASYNPMQQALGAGISALGLYKGLTA